MNKADAVPLLYVRPREGSRVTPEQLHRSLSEHGAPHLGLTGPDGPYQFPDGTYEIITGGPAGAECARMVLRHEFWEVAREDAAPPGIGVLLVRHAPSPDGLICGGDDEAQHGYRFDA